MNKALLNSRFNRAANQLQKGNKKAGERIFNYFSPLLHRFFVVRIKNKAIAEDLTQETFLKLVDKIETFDKQKGNFPGWFWQIAKNTLKDYYRKKKTITFQDADLKEENLVPEENFSQNKEEINKILKIIKNFSETEQEIFSLRYLSDLSYKEISLMLNQPAGKLRVIVHRLNQKIKKLINND